MGEASGGRSDSVVDAATIAVAAHRAVGVPALAAGLRSAANAKTLATVVVGEAGHDLLGGELGNLVCNKRKVGCVTATEWID